MNRLADWKLFTEHVEDHIVGYTIPQYGDAPNDEVEKWTTQECINAISKYAKRFNNNQRGEAERLRDMFKIAHFACIAYGKMAKK